MKKLILSFSILAFGPQSSLAGTGAASCRAIMALNDVTSQNSVRQLAELHLAYLKIDDGPMRSKMKIDFEDHLRRLETSLGGKRVRNMLKKAIKELRATQQEVMPEAPREKESVLTATTTFELRTKFELNPNGQGGSLEYVLSDGSYLVNDYSRKGLSRLEIDANGQVKEEEFPFSHNRTGLEPWHFSNRGGHWFAEYKPSTYYETEYFVFDVKNERKWELVEPASGERKLFGSRKTYRSKIAHLSPGGRYALSIDIDGRFHRVDLDENREDVQPRDSLSLVRHLFKTEARYAGGWVLDDGRIVAFGEDGFRYELDKSFNISKGQSIKELFGFEHGQLEKVDVSDDLTQAVFRFGNKSFLTDLSTGQSKEIPFGWINDIVWHKDFLIIKPAKDADKVTVITRAISDVDPARRTQYPAGVFRTKAPFVVLEITDGSIELVDLRNGQQRSIRIEEHLVPDIKVGGRNLSATVSPDGSMVAVWAFKNGAGVKGISTVSIIDTLSNDKVGEIQIDERGFTTRVEFSRDGRHLLLTQHRDSWDTLLRIYELVSNGQKPAGFQ